MVPYEALYGRHCRSPIGWFEPIEVELLGPDSVHEAFEKMNLIVQRLKTTQSRQKSYTDMRRRELEVDVGYKVFLKVSPMKGVVRFGRKYKLSPHFISPYEIVRRIGKVSYELKIPSEMSMVHPVFHILILRLYKPDPSHVLIHKVIEVNEGLSYEEEPVQILDRQVRRLRTKDVASVKVLWRNNNTEEATWAAEEDMKNIPSPISYCRYVLNLLIIESLRSCRLKSVYSFICVLAQIIWYGGSM
ncbi:uncharacterized protein LOC132039057 [Lycium ferocissimum]|uniref:uncharacterized protein LOC132039057 n=1 Tax=Lycium ferocissimum TaxID=112874 RepID=UPI0028162A31|nr:uncharacterized protein LOC132039057 [Lycium ferocissimum]